MRDPSIVPVREDGVHLMFSGSLAEHALVALLCMALKMKSAFLAFLEETSSTSPVLDEGWIKALRGELLKHHVPGFAYYVAPRPKRVARSG